MIRSIFPALAGLAAVVACPTAQAATQYELQLQTGGKACTGALPAHEGALRKRPQAIVNEGEIPAFVTCSLQFNDANSTRPEFAVVNFGNSTPAAVTVACTVIDGFVAWGPATFHPQTFVVPANTVQMEWPLEPPEGEAAFATPSVGVSCNLPPGIAVNYYGYAIQADIGL